MSNFWKAVAAVGVVGAVLHASAKNVEQRKIENAEEERRKSAECIFDDGITQEEFEVIAKRAGKGIKRLSELKVDEMVVIGTVHSQSGITDWNFKIDFSDYGHLTGKFWMSTDNDDSEIPRTIAGRISDAIKYFPECVDDAFEKELDKLEEIKGEKKKQSERYCPYCGEKLVGAGARFCGYCGSKI